MQTEPRPAVIAHLVTSDSASLFLSNLDCACVWRPVQDSGCALSNLFLKRSFTEPEVHGFGLGWPATEFQDPPSHPSSHNAGGFKHRQPCVAIDMGAAM